jgi:hypothetical protein
MPQPAALATRAAPITTAASARRTRAPTGSSTCVHPHPAHRARRGRNRRRTTPPARSTRGRAYPHGPSRCPHPGHTSRPWASRRSTAAPSLPTVSTGASKHRVRPSRRLDQKTSGRASLSLDALTLSSHMNKGNPPGLPTVLLTPNDAELPPRAHTRWRATTQWGQIKPSRWGQRKLTSPATALICPRPACVAVVGGLRPPVQRRLAGRYANRRSRVFCALCVLGAAQIGTSWRQRALRVRYPSRLTLAWRLPPGEDTHLQPARLVGPPRRRM